MYLYKALISPALMHTQPIYMVINLKDKPLRLVQNHFQALALKQQFKKQALGQWMFHSQIPLYTREHLSCISLRVYRDDITTGTDRTLTLGR